MLFENFFNKLFSLHHIIKLNDTLMIDKLEEQKNNLFVHINKSDSILYCICLSSTGNTANFLSEQKINQLFENFVFAKNARIYQALYKKGIIQKNLIFSSNYELLELMAKGMDGYFLTDEEIVNTMYELFDGVDYGIVDKAIKPSSYLIEELEYDDIAYSFNGIIKESLYNSFLNKKVKLFQSYKAKARRSPVNLTHLFSINFEGVIWNSIEFNKDVINTLLTRKRHQAFVDGKDKNFKELTTAFNGNDIDLALINSSLFLTKGDSNTAIEIGGTLGLEYFEKHIQKIKYVANTPILARDGYFDVVVNRDYFYNFFSSVHKRTLKNANFYGIDINGNFFNGRFDKTTEHHSNKSSDFLILGVKGSGKTTFTNGILAQTLNFSVDKTKTKILGNTQAGINQNKIRYFDIKNSGRVLAELIAEEYPNYVQFINTSLNEFSFNPVNLKHWVNETGRVEVDQDELTMNILLLSIVLEAKNRSDDAGLNASEQALFKGVVTNIYANNMYEPDHIMSFKSSHPKVYQQLINLGYRDPQNIKEVTHAGYEYLKVPTLRTIIKGVKTLAEDSHNVNTQNIAKQLLTKLELIDKIGIFSNYDKFDLEDTNFLHIDFDPVKDLDEYVPIFLAFFLKMYRMDKINQVKDKAKGIDRVYITYVFEEAKNVLEQKSFEEFIAKFINEARSYRIKVGFTTQLVSHVPNHVFSQIANKFFLFPEKNQKKALIDDLVAKAKPDEQTQELMWKTPEFGVLLWNEHGSSAFKLALTNKEVEAYGQSQ